MLQQKYFAKSPAARVKSNPCNITDNAQIPIRISIEIVSIQKYSKTFCSFSELLKVTLSVALLRPDIDRTSSSNSSSSNFARRHPFAVWFSSFLSAYAGSILACILMAESPLKPFCNPNCLLYVTAAWYASIVVALCRPYYALRSAFISNTDADILTQFMFSSSSPFSNLGTWFSTPPLTFVTD